MKNKQEKIFWHITKKENLENIKKNGIKANEDNEVFLLDDSEIQHPFHTQSFFVSKFVAFNQLFLNEFVIIAVDVEGLELEPDDVAESTAKYQYIYKGDIKPNRLKGYMYDNTYDLQEEYKKMNKMFNK
jgi:hypothetical protein